MTLRLVSDLDNMRDAAIEACAFIRHMDKTEFLADTRTQKAVIMCLMIVGEAAGKVIERHPVFAIAHDRVRWRDMRGMRNRIAHGYFDIDLEIVWSTLQTAIPELLIQLPQVIAEARETDRASPS